MNHKNHSELSTNASGCYDPTAYNALKPIVKEEEQIEKCVNKLVYIIKGICDLAGFEVVNRIEFKHKDSGRFYK